MSNTRTPTHIWLDAKIRELSFKNIGVYVVHKGEKMDGQVLVKVSNLSGDCALYTQQRNFETDQLEWINYNTEEIVTEIEANDLVDQAKRTDPDLWVIEVEDKSMQNPFAD